MTVFERVKKLASEHKISLLQLNDRAGLGKNAIYKWKTQNPSTENLKKVADVLGVSVDYLLRNTNNHSDAPVNFNGKFRQISNENNLDFKEQSELSDEFIEFMQFKAQILANKKNQKKD